MKKTQWFKICGIGVFVMLVFGLASLTFKSVSVKNDKKQVLENKSASSDDSKSFYDKYKTAIRVDDANNIIVKINPEDGKNYEKISFRIKKIEIAKETGKDKETGENQYNVLVSNDTLFKDVVLSKSSPVTMEVAKISALAPPIDGESLAYDTIRILLESKENDPNENKIISYYINLSTDILATATTQSVALDEDEIISDETVITGVDCSKDVKNQTEFEKEYCSVEKGDFISSKNASHHVENKTGDSKYTNELKSKSKLETVIPLKCSSTHLTTKSYVDGKTKQDKEDYFVNEAFYKASKTMAADSYTYVYNFVPGLDPVTVKKQLNKTCTEQVHVEYGPPVAATAGMCFEYNVRVTSKVTCTASAIEKPKIYNNYCTPKPYCYHPETNLTLRQAGPSEDFDLCIQDCDGGKYTTKCSKKCYKEVYGSTNSKTSLNNYANYAATRLSITSNDDDKEADKCIQIEKNGKYHYDMQYFLHLGKQDFYGCYYYKGGKILWKSGTKGNVAAKIDASEIVNVGDSPGRWYYLNRSSGWYNIPGEHFGIRYDRRYAQMGDGFFRILNDYEENGVCHSECIWDGCLPKDKKGKYTGEATQYLNPAQMHVDNKANKKVYDAIKEKAKIASTCHTSTATFNVKVNNSNDEYAKYFPADDILKSTEDNLSISEASKLKGKNYLLDYSNCYQNSKLKGVETYQSTWGFSGTWIDLHKTHAVSFTPKDNYSFIKNKFCLPRDAKPVNERFWTYYQTRYVGNDKSYSIDSSEYINKCVRKDSTGLCFNKVERFKDDEVSKWNIEAITKDFGLFGWDFNIKCFYGYSKAMTSKNGVDCTKQTTVSEECKEGSKVRSVDLEDMFPDPNGDEHTADEAGRTPGFNWSQYATNTEKDPNYKSDPVAYMRWVQSKERRLKSEGKSIYDDDDELDYQIVITKEELRKIKERVKSEGFSYTKFESDGSNEPVGSVAVYKSKLLRSGEYLKNVKLPSSALLRCNNIHNGSCMDLSNGGQ